MWHSSICEILSPQKYCHLVSIYTALVNTNIYKNEERIQLAVIVTQSFQSLISKMPNSFQNFCKGSYLKITRHTVVTSVIKHLAIAIIISYGTTNYELITQDIQLKETCVSRNHIIKE